MGPQGGRTFNFFQNIYRMYLEQTYICLYLSLASWGDQLGTTRVTDLKVVNRNLRKRKNLHRYSALRIMMNGCKLPFPPLSFILLWPNRQFCWFVGSLKEIRLELEKHQQLPAGSIIQTLLHVRGSFNLSDQMCPWANTHNRCTVYIYNTQW